MKSKLQAGAELDLLTKDEVAEVLRSWGHELTRGARFRRRSFYGVTTGAGDLSIAPVEAGPNEGMVWAVTRIVVSGLADGETVSLYANSADPSNLLLPRVGRVEYPGDHGLVLVSGDQLVIGGTSLTVGAAVVVNLQIKEVPALMAWSL